MSGPSAVADAARVPPPRASVAAEPSNDNTPRLELRVVGDGRAFIQALARTLVRHELIAAGLIAGPPES